MRVQHQLSINMLPKTGSSRRSQPNVRDLRKRVAPTDSCHPHPANDGTERHTRLRTASLATSTASCYRNAGWPLVACAPVRPEGGGAARAQSLLSTPPVSVPSRELRRRRDARPCHHNKRGGPKAAPSQHQCAETTSVQVVQIKKIPTPYQTSNHPLQDCVGASRTPAQHSLQYFGVDSWSLLAIADNVEYCRCWSNWCRTGVCRMSNF